MTEQEKQTLTFDKSYFIQEWQNGFFVTASKKRIKKITVYFE